MVTAEEAVTENERLKGLVYITYICSTIDIQMIIHSPNY